MVIFFLMNSIGYFTWMDDKMASTFHILKKKVFVAVVDFYIAGILVNIPFTLTKMLMGLRFIF